MLPVNRTIPQSFEDVKDEIFDMYQDIAVAFNGSLREWTPTISGSTTNGSGTYTTNEGYYYRQGLLCHVWFYLVWTAHTGTGNIKLDLPFNVRLSAQDFYTDSVEVANIALSANYNYFMIRADSNSSQASLIEVGTNNSPQAVTMDVAGSLRGHLVFLGQEKR